MSISVIPFEAGQACLDWLGLCDALEAGHTLPKAEIADTFLYRGGDTLLTRSAWIDGMGIAVKSATIFPDNSAANLPTINGGMNLYSDADGILQAVVDFHLVTKWKTAGDSLLGALKLAPPSVGNILIVGAGTVAASLVEAFGAGFPNASFTVWNRSPEGARALAARFEAVTPVDDLAKAVEAADIILTATMSSEPVIKGDWLRGGQLLNMIGAYRPDMREADDTALRKGQIFVDSRDTTIGHIGEIEIPLQAGVITRDDILGDFYDIAGFSPCGPDEIKIFKNGGGAHLDLMTGRYIFDRWNAAG